MPKGTLIVCQTCGEAFNRPARDTSSADCPKCQAEIAVHAAGPGAADASVPIIAQYRIEAGQWSAWFEDSPQYAFGGDMPVRAIRRLLEFTEPPHGQYVLICDRDTAGGVVLRQEIIWYPPELLFPCPACNGRGEYIGLMERGPCKDCGGRKVVPV